MSAMDKKSSQKEMVKDETLRKNTDEWFKFPFEVEDVDEETNAQMLQDFTSIRNTWVRIGPDKWFFPSTFKKDVEVYYNFKARPTDVWVVTFPRSGTTWMQEMVWLLASELNYEVAAQVPLFRRFPFLEFDSMDFQHNKKTSSSVSKSNRELFIPEWESLAQTTEKRFIKTHLPLQLLPPNLLETGCKVIYVARNPKDVAVSLYHFSRSSINFGFVGNFSQFWHLFQNGQNLWMPYWPHIEEGWRRRDDKNLLFMFYEDMSKDLKSSIKQVADFLEVRYTDQQYEALQAHLKFENLRKNKSVNHGLVFENITSDNTEKEFFIREGKVGGWNEYFTGELNEDVDKWIEDNLKKTGVQFPTI